jgi:hypothetical protein
MRPAFENRMRNRLAALRAEFEDLKRKAGKAETNLELEYYTLLEELRTELESAEQKFDLLLEAHEDQWEHIGDEVEQVWRAARDLIKAITAP